MLLLWGSPARPPCPRSQRECGDETVKDSEGSEEESEDENDTEIQMGVFLRRRLPLPPLLRPRSRSLQYEPSIRPCLAPPGRELHGQRPLSGASDGLSVVN